MKKVKYVSKNLTYVIATYLDCLVHIITCYIPPYSTDHEKKILNHLQWMVRTIFSRFRRSRVIIMGDFNFYLNRVEKDMKEFNLVPVIQQATHNRGNVLD